MLTCSCRWSHMPLTGFRFRPACVATSTYGGGQVTLFSVLGISKDIPVSTTPVKASIPCQSRKAPQCLFWLYLKWDPQLLQYSLHLGLEHLCWQLPSPNAHLVGEDYQLGTDKDTLEPLTTAQPEHYTNMHVCMQKHAPHPVLPHRQNTL